MNMRHFRYIPGSTAAYRNAKIMKKKVTKFETPILHSSRAILNAKDIQHFITFLGEFMKRFIFLKKRGSIKQCVNGIITKKSE